MVGERSGKWRPQISSLLPIVSLCLSLFSVYISELVRKDVARLDVIKTEYGLYHDLAQLQLQYPSMAHLFTVTNEAYDSTVGRIKTSLGTTTAQDRAKMVLQERALAHYMFTTYEEAFYLWQQALQGGDQRRLQLAHDDLAYFNEAICSNPRLLWYWDFKGGKLDRAFADELRDYYKANVVKGCTTEADAAGPFGP